MFKINIITVVFILVFVACLNNESERKALRIKNINLLVENTKQGFNPLKHGFGCDSLNVKVVKNLKISEKLMIFLGSTPVDTINLHELLLDIAEKEVMITDFNFDGFCDLVIPNIVSANHGGIDYYYYLYNSTTAKYKNIKSLPKFIGGFKLDIKNHRVKIYCPNEDCFAYYKYTENGDFVLDQGKFEVNM